MKTKNIEKEQLVLENLGNENVENLVAVTEITEVIETTKEVVQTEDVKIEAEATTEVEEIAEEKTEEEIEEELNYEEEAKKIKKKKVVEPPKFERTTRLEKSTVNRTIKWLHKNKEKLRFDLAIQRNSVWTLEQKSNLIHSILYGYPVPPVMVMETEDDNVWFLDGKQRGTALLEFVNDEYALSRKTEGVIGHKIAGLKFSDLSEDMQDIIYDETVTLIKIKGITKDEINEMFVRWNSGTPLNKMELTRAIYAELIEQVNEIAETPFFAEDIKLAKSARNRFQDQELILQIAMLLEKGENGFKGFGTKEIAEFVKEMKDTNKILSKKTMTEFKNGSGFMTVAFSNLSEEAQKTLKKANTPIVFYTATKAIKDKIHPVFFAKFIEKFLVEDYSTESAYGESLQSGSAKKENVLTRINEMDLHFQDFIEKAIEEGLEKEVYKKTKAK